MRNSKHPTLLRTSFFALLTVCAVALFPRTGRSSASCDSLVVQCQDPGGPQCGQSTCNTPCRTISITNIDPNFAVTDVVVTCNDPNSTGMAICAVSAGGCLTSWIVAIPPGLSNCSTSPSPITKPPGCSGLTTGNTLVINECGCCSFDLTITFSDGTKCTKSLNSTTCLCN